MSLLLSYTSRNAINVSATTITTCITKINHKNAIIGYSRRGFSLAITFQQQQQQQQQYQRFLGCSTSTKFSTMTMMTKPTTVKPATSDNFKTNTSTSANTNTNTNTNTAMLSSSSRRTMMTSSSNKADNEGTNNSSSNIISNRGGAMIPNVLRMATNSSSNSNTDTTTNTNDSTTMNKMMIHLQPPDAPVGLQLYKKALYCPRSHILRTSLHVGSDDFNQKVEGIVVVGGSSVDHDITPDASTGSDSTPWKEVSIDEARNHARNSGLRLLATIHDYVQGDLSRVEQILTITGIVNSTNNNSNDPTTDNKNNNNNSSSMSNSRNPITTTTSQYHGSIIDGCSQVFVEAFGKEIGIGTRVCYGGNIGSTVACYVELRLRPSFK